MPTRLRTLPDRHGGRVVLGLLIAVLALGLALRRAGGADAARGRRQRRRGLHADRQGRCTRTATTAGPSQSSPNDWSPGAPLLYGAVYYLTGGVHVKAALLLVALLGTGTILLTYLLGRRLAGPVAGLIGGAAGRDLPGVHRQHGPAAGRARRAVLAAGGDARVPVGVRRRQPLALAGARRAARPHHAHPARVPAVRGACSRCSRSLRVWLGHGAGLLRGLVAGALLVAAFCGVLAPWTARNYVVARPLRAGHHRRRQGAVRRHLPARRAAASSSSSAS